MIKHMHLLYLSDMSTNMLLACVSFLQALELWIWPVRPNHLVGRSSCGTCQPGSPGFAIERFSSQISHTNRNKWPKSPLTGKNQHVQHTHSQVTPKPERNTSQEHYLQSHWMWWFHACWRESKKRWRRRKTAQGALSFCMQPVRQFISLCEGFTSAQSVRLTWNYTPVEDQMARWFDAMWSKQIWSIKGPNCSTMLNPTCCTSMNVKSVRNDCGPVIACTMIGQDMTFLLLITKVTTTYTTQASLKKTKTNIESKCH